MPVCARHPVAANRPMKYAVPALLRFDQLAAKPWPNGQGVTRDVAGERVQGARIRWLISIAELVEDAEFSYYHGCNRILTLIGDNAIDLHIDHAPPIRCSPLVPVCFAGDQRARCSMIGGQTRALNVFMSRGRVQGSVSVLTLGADHEVVLPHRAAGVHCVSGVAKVDGKLMTRGDTFVWPQDRVMQTSQEAAQLLVVDLSIEPGHSA